MSHILKENKVKDQFPVASVTSVGISTGGCTSSTLDALPPNLAILFLIFSASSAET